MQNMKLCYVRFGKEEELARLQHRLSAQSQRLERRTALTKAFESLRINQCVASVSGLGHALFFPFFQPENAKFELDRMVFGSNQLPLDCKKQQG